MVRLYKKHNLEIPHKIDAANVRPDVGPPTSLGEWAARLNKVPLAKQPGATFEYSMSTDLGRIRTPDDKTTWFRPNRVAADMGEAENLIFW